MKRWQILLVLAFLTIFGTTAVTAQKSKKTNKKSVAKKSVVKSNAKVATLNDAFKTLAQGDQSSFEEPFVFVARNTATYAQLKSKVEGLPVASEIDFEKTVVVAAFAGTRPTPGYSISFERTSNSARIKINLIEPPKDMMLAQVLTAPYRIVAIPLDSESSLEIEPSQIWQEKALTYRLTTGTFEISGGFAGKSEGFRPIGSIRIWRAGDLVTASFNLNGVGSKKARVLTDVASGKFDNNAINLSRIDPGQFVETPHPALKADGTLDEKKLILNFESLPTNVADGFAGKGRIEAVK